MVRLEGGQHFLCLFSNVPTPHTSAWASKYCLLVKTGSGTPQFSGIHGSILGSPLSGTMRLEDTLGLRLTQAT